MGPGFSLRARSYTLCCGRGIVAMPLLLLLLLLLFKRPLGSGIELTHHISYNIRREENMQQQRSSWSSTAVALMLNAPGDRALLQSAGSWPLRDEREVRTLQLPGSSIALRVYSTDFLGSRLSPDWWMLFESGKWEPNIFRVIVAAQRARPGLHVDSGSWIGPTALFAAHLAPSVLAVEPDPWAYDELVANFNLNPILRVMSEVHLVRTCLAPELSTRTFFGVGISGSTENAAAYAGTAPTWSVHCGPLQTLVTDLVRIKPGGWSFWKLDVEGAEITLFPESLPLLEEFGWPAVHLSLHPFYWQDKTPIAIANLLAAMRRFEYIYDSDLARIDLSAAHVNGSANFNDFVLSMKELLFL